MQRALRGFPAGPEVKVLNSALPMQVSEFDP